VQARPNASPKIAKTHRNIFFKALAEVKKLRIFASGFKTSHIGVPIIDSKTLKIPGNEQKNISTVKKKKKK